MLDVVALSARGVLVASRESCAVQWYYYWRTARGVPTVVAATTTTRVSSLD
jgi:hypothetical protein